MTKADSADTDLSDAVVSKIDATGINIAPVDPGLANTDPVRTDTADIDCAGANAADNSVDPGSVNPDRTDTDIVKMNSTVNSFVDTSPAGRVSVEIDPNFRGNELVAIRLTPKMNTVTTQNSSSRHRRITLQALLAELQEPNSVQTEMGNH